MTNINITQRPIDSEVFQTAKQAGLDELLCRIIAARVPKLEGHLDALLSPSLKHLDQPSTLPDIQAAAGRIADAIEKGEKIGIVTDYDVDGITSHTLLTECLVQDFGHDQSKVSGFIGHRLSEGYGLSSPVCERILDVAPQVVITADCGSSDEERIRRLKDAGIDVIVTDHHGIPEQGVPLSAFATVSPARVDSGYKDKAIAGCTVAWLLMSVVRQNLIERQVLPPSAVKLTRHLDLVSLGTVADAVSLFSHNNRALVESGLVVLNQRHRPCWQALADLLGRHDQPFTVDDLGFQIGPRINARGRMADPFAAWRFLAASDRATADHWLQLLDQNNQERRATEKGMVGNAKKQVSKLIKKDQQVIVIYDDDYHAGVQGIVASRLVEAFGRVTCVMSPGVDSGLISGSLRSIPGVDVGAALKHVDNNHRDVLNRFGGHPAAAGVTIAKDQLERFRLGLASAVAEQIGKQQLTPVMLTDGELVETHLNMGTWLKLQQLSPFGRGFEKPVFEGQFEVVGLRAVGADPVHLSLNLRGGGNALRGIWFNALESADQPWPLEANCLARCIYQLEPDSYRGGETIQLLIRYAEVID